MVESIVLVNKSLGTFLPINMATRDYVLENVDWGAIESSNKSYKFINQVGVYVTGTTLESRTISILGWVVADTIDDMKRRKKFLNSFVNPLQRVDLQYNEYRIEGIPETSIKYGSEMPENNEVMCKFLINLFCPDPMFYTQNGSYVSVANWAPKFRFPLIIPQDTGIIMGLRSPSTIATIINTGTLPCGFVITFQASGTVENPKIIDINTQEYIRLNHTMQAGETIRISTLDNNKTVRQIIGEDSINAFNFLDFANSTFLQLAVGINYLRYDADSGLDNLSVEFKFDPRYLEVQE